MSMKNPLTPAGIEPATVRFVAQHLNHCATAVSSNRSCGVLKCESLLTCFDLDISSETSGYALSAILHSGAGKVMILHHHGNVGKLIGRNV